MKKYLFLLALVVGLFGSMSANWVELRARAIYTDPFLIDYSVSTYGGPISNRYLRIYMEISNTTQAYNYKMTLGVYGTWAGLGTTFKYFDVIVPKGQLFKTQDFPLAPADNPWVHATDLAYEGPE